MQSKLFQGKKGSDIAFSKSTTQRELLLLLLLLLLFKLQIPGMTERRDEEESEEVKNKIRPTKSPDK